MKDQIQPSSPACSGWTRIPLGSVFSATLKVGPLPFAYEFCARFYNVNDSQDSLIPLLVNWYMTCKPLDVRAARSTPSEIHARVRRVHFPPLGFPVPRAKRDHGGLTDYLALIIYYYFRLRSRSSGHHLLLAGLLLLFNSEIRNSTCSCLGLQAGIGSRISTALS